MPSGNAPMDILTDVSLSADIAIKLLSLEGLRIVQTGFFLLSNVSSAIVPNWPII